MFLPMAVCVFPILVSVRGNKTNSCGVALPDQHRCKKWGQKVEADRRSDVKKWSHINKWGF